MKILAVESSGLTASAAVIEDDLLKTEFTVSNKLTHSETLLPMIRQMLDISGIDKHSLDAIAISAGPGSFTGIRIGVAAVKGLAIKDNKPCAGVSTLESIAYNFIDEKCIVCAAMDARCNQVYTALFRSDGSKITRLCDDKAVSIDDLRSEISKYNEKIYLAGDGAELCFKNFGSEFADVYLSGEHRSYQRAYGSAVAALNNNNFIDSALIAPAYLRLPQAERELRIRKGEKI